MWIGKLFKLNSIKTLKGNKFSKMLYFFLDLRITLENIYIFLILPSIIEQSRYFFMLLKREMLIRVFANLLFVVPWILLKIWTKGLRKLTSWPTQKLCKILLIIEQTLWETLV